MFGYKPFKAWATPPSSYELDVEGHLRSYVPNAAMPERVKKAIVAAQGGKEVRAVWAFASSTYNTMLEPTGLAIVTTEAIKFFAEEVHVFT